MKKRGKKLLAGAAALAMSCSMVTGWANGVEIVDVKVLNSATDEGTSFKNAEGVIENVKLNTEQMLQVTVKLTNGAAENPAVAAGDVTFLSNINGENITLDNSTIQYVDQQTASTDGTATITFRPRMSIGTQGVGAFIAKAGGTDVANTAEFNYTVVAPSVPLSASIGGAITEGNDAVITLTVPEGKNLPGAGTVTVKDGTNDATVKSYDNATGTLTVSGLTAGLHKLVISADGYVSTSVDVTVNSANVPVDPNDKPGVTTDVKDKLGAMKPADDGSVTVPTSEKTADGKYNINYTVTTSDDTKINKGADGKITLANNVFGAKITVTASVGTDDPVTAKKDIYLVADPNVNISFGNLDLISDSNGADAFASSTALSNAALTETQMTGIKAEALNYALDRRTPDAAINSAVDYDLNGDVTLSEYRMLKLMLEGTEGFTANDMVRERAGWISKNGSTSTPESN